MYRNIEKRFEYDINPQAPHELERHPQKYPTRNYPEYPTMTTTPVNKRSLPNTTTLDDRHNASTNHDLYPPRNDDKFERARANSTSGIKRNPERPPVNKSTKNQFAEQTHKQNKKIYFGGDDSYNYDPHPNKTTKHAVRQYEESQYREETKHKQSNDYTLQENVNYSNTRFDHSKETKSKKYEQKNQTDNRSPQINEKEIVDKIARINRLNEEINSRLQRMLSKMEV